MNIKYVHLENSETFKMGDKLSTRLMSEAKNTQLDDYINKERKLTCDLSSSIINRCKLCDCRQAIRVEIKGLKFESFIILICKNCYNIEKYFEKTTSLSKDNFRRTSKVPSESIIYQIKNLDMLMKITENFFVEGAIELANGNKSRAAKLLGISLRTMRYKINQIIEANGKLDDIITLDEFQILSEIEGDLSRKLSLAERYYVEKAIALSKGNKSQAARTLGISLRTMRYKISQYKL